MNENEGAYKDRKKAESEKLIVENIPSAFPQDTYRGCMWF